MMHGGAVQEFQQYIRIRLLAELQNPQLLQRRVGLRRQLGLTDCAFSERADIADNTVCA